MLIGDRMENEKKTGDTKLQDFATAEVQKLAEQKQKRMEEKGYKPFWSMPEGTYIIEFANEMPRDNPAYTDRPIFRIKVDGEEYDYSINRNSPLYRDIMQNIMNGNYKLSITRIGTGKSDTRYKVVKA